MINFRYDKNKIRITGDHFADIREHFSVNDETARFRLKGRARFYANTRIYSITPTGLFECGMFYDVLRHIKESYPNEEITIDEALPLIVKPALKDARLYNKLTYELRDYHDAACNKSIAYGRGHLKIGTGAGKT